MKTFSVAPVLQVRSLDESLRYYTRVLGFAEDFRFGDYAGVTLGNVELHLCGHQIHERPVGGGAAAIVCDEIDTYCDEIRKLGALVKVEPADRPYGMKDFTVLDPDGNHLHFGCANKPN